MISGVSFASVVSEKKNNQYCDLVKCKKIMSHENCKKNPCCKIEEATPDGPRGHHQPCVKKSKSKGYT